MRAWRGSADVGDLLQLEPGFEGRLGNTWAKGRLKVGDLVVCLRHSGDCFYDYMLVDHGLVHRAPDGGGSREMIRLEPVKEPFGAYQTGRHLMRLSSEQVGLLLAGEDVYLDPPAAYVRPDQAAADQAASQIVNGLIAIERMGELGAAALRTRLAEHASDLRGLAALDLLAGAKGRSKRG